MSTSTHSPLKKTNPHRVSIDQSAVAEVLKHYQKPTAAAPIEAKGSACHQDANADAKIDSTGKLSWLPVDLAANTPPLGTLYIYMTDGCNLACKHCWISPDYKLNKETGGHVSAKKLLESCAQAKRLGLKHVKLTGGEPLLHPDFCELVYGIKALGLNLWMESNMTLLTPENTKAILDTMTFFSTSIDGATAESHDGFRGVANSFDTTCQAVKLLSPHINIQVIMSVHAGNVHEVEEVMKLSHDLGAGSIKFNLIHSSGRADQMRKKNRVLDVAEFIRLGNLVEGEWEAKYKIRCHYSWPPAFRHLSSFANAGAGGMCGIDHILGILGTGQYAMCGIGKNIPELSYGSVDDNLADIWNHHVMLKQLRDEVPTKLEGVCGNCIFQHTCKGHCVANNYHETKNLNAPHWFCQEAYDKGIFPTSRLIDSAENSAYCYEATA